MIKKPPFQDQTEIHDRKQIEAMIDETVDESFPASDPPSWGSLAKKCNESKKKSEESDETNDSPKPDSRAA